MSADLQPKAESEEKSKVSLSIRPKTPEKCPICLAEPTNASFTDSCYHRFCFICLLEWSKIKAECPLCKQKFKHIIHNVRSMDDYDKYEVPLPPTPPDLMHVPPRRPQLGGNMPGERIELLHHIRRLQTNVGVWGGRPRGGLTFATGTWANFNTSREMERPRGRFGAHLQRVEGDLQRYRALFLASENMTRDELVSQPTFRRLVYERGLETRPIEETTNQDDLRIRDTSAAFFQENPAVLHRIVPWLNRELEALFDNNEEQIRTARDQVMYLLRRYEIGSRRFRHEISPFLIHRTERFINELYQFARSPYETLAEYDRRSQFRRSLPDTVAADVEVVDILPPQPLVNHDDLNRRLNALHENFQRLRREMEEQAERRLSQICNSNRQQRPQPVLVDLTVDSDEGEEVDVVDGNQEIQLHSPQLSRFQFVHQELEQRRRRAWSEDSDPDQPGPSRRRGMSPESPLLKRARQWPRAAKFDPLPSCAPLTQTMPIYVPSVASLSGPVLPETSTPPPLILDDLSPHTPTDQRLMTPNTPPPAPRTPEYTPTTPSYSPPASFSPEYIPRGTPSPVEVMSPESDDEVEVLCEMKPKHLRTPPLVTLEEEEEEPGPSKKKESSKSPRKKSKPRSKRKR